MEITPEIEEIVFSSIEKAINESKKLTTTEFLLCSDDLKILYFNTHHFLTVTETRLCSEKVLLAYIDMVVSRENTFNDLAFNVLNEKCKMYYINKIVTNRGLKLTDDQFMYLPDKLKIEYIMFRGVHNVTETIREWYPKWKKAKGRDHRIDLILLED